MLYSFILLLSVLFIPLQSACPDMDLLEMKFQELYDHVDHLIIIEPSEDFSGKSKPLYFLENQERFAKYQDKIIYVMITDKSPTHDPLQRQHEHFLQVKRYISNRYDNDVIFLFYDGTEVNEN